ncbi:MAG: ComF family protein [Burkholderiales bacterium]
MLKTIGERLFGGSCFLCRGKADALLCAACDADLPRISSGPDAERCPRCALASPAGALCGRCLSQPPAYDATQAALGYEFPADVLIQALKFRGELALASFLGDLLSGCVSRAGIDCVLPVPLSRAKLRSRGYNQSLEIARRVAAVIGVRLAPDLCERSRDTASQMDLPLEERAKNVRGAFHCPGLVAGLGIAVLDDVMTTGATLDEVAGTLKRAGAARVVNWVVARTPPGHV